MAADGWRRRLRSALTAGSRGGRPARRLAFLHLPRTGGTAVQHHLESIVGGNDVLRIRLPPDFLERLDEVRSSPIVLGHFFYPGVRLMPDALVATVVREPVERSISVWEYLQWQTQHPDHKTLAERGVRSLDDFVEDEVLSGHVRDNQTRLLGIDYDLEGIVDAIEAGDIDVSEAQRRAAEAEAAPADAATLERAKRRLEAMALVGVTEELPAFTRRLELALHLPAGRALETDNATPREMALRRGAAYDEAARQRLAKLNRLDAELYSFAKDLWEARHLVGSTSATLPYDV